MTRRPRSRRLPLLAVCLGDRAAWAAPWTAGQLGLRSAEFSRYLKRGIVVSTRRSVADS